jgi:cellulose synthase operon protein YhjU
LDAPQLSSIANQAREFLMGLWSLYFFVKLALHVGGYIDFNVGMNLALALIAALRPKNTQQRFAKNLVVAPLAVMLLYHDSWLPPFARLLAQAQNLAGFSLSYLVELLGRFFNIKVLAQLAALVGAYLLLRRKLRMSTFAILGILAVAVVPSRNQTAAGPIAPIVSSGTATANTAAPDARNLRPEALNALLSEFYRQQSSRAVRMQSLGEEATPFDIVLLHICSLSWDDLAAAQMLDAPLLKRFDLLFTAFNSGASYSGPAAIRLLRGTCGQSEHKELYGTPAAGCLLIDGLQEAGFEPHWLMNHDGHFGNFFADVQERGGLKVNPENNAGAAVAQHSFDGSPIYDDYSVLSRWWAKREANNARHVVLYYNTVSLHDGNRVDGATTLSTTASFHLRAERLMAGVGKFLDDLQRSGRHVVVVLVPEHGAAVRGDRKQISGLREIPTPAITQVPVGIAMINRRRGAAAQQTIGTPSSFLALTELLSRFIANDPFAESGTSFVSLTQDLPQTESVSENEGTVVMRIGKQYMMRTPDGEWSPWESGS